ncbi:MAG: hypothetical protein AAFX40_02455 [Cyanobacteria bacterium J06639_1]
MTGTRQTDFSQFLPEWSIPRDFLEVALRRQERILESEDSIRYQLGQLTRADIDRLFGWLDCP